MTCAVSIQLQNFRRVWCEFLLFKFRHCEDYSEQSKRFFEPSTFAEQRCSLKRECFYFVYLHFHRVFWSLFAYITFIIINRGSELSVDNFKNQVERFLITPVLQARMCTALVKNPFFQHKLISGQM